ncbi:MAG: hypothetical protein M0003_16550 [Acidithiobacillus sp.]|nr:hypothetical protein [Acidithiobacillus sp.]
MDHDTQRQDAIVRNVTPPQAQAILHAFDGKSELSTHEIYECVSTHFPDLSRLEHGILLGKLKQEGMIAPGIHPHTWQRLATLDDAATTTTAVPSAPIKRTFAIRKEPLAERDPAPEDQKTLWEVAEWLEEGRQWMARGAAILERHQADR